MKRITILAAFVMGFSFLLHAQIAPDKYYVQFTDKNNSPYSINNPGEFLSQRSIDRRVAQNIQVDIKDLPVNPQYLQGVSDAGASILNPTKWLNGVTVQTSDSGVIIAIEALPYVASIYKSPNVPANIESEKKFFVNGSYGNMPSTNVQLKAASFYDYGPSFNQINMVKGDQMHDLGYRGEGILIGVLDAGFSNANNLPVFDNLWNDGRILATRDMVYGGPVTFNQHDHGTMVLSTMGGHFPGELVGTAPEASYILLRTEYGPTELIIEEYYWVSGAEFADSLGADVLNTSLGYSEFPNDTLQNHTYEDMDGNTTPITIGADIAASRGMIVVNSAGNSGNSTWYYITAPADGDSVFSIGAVNAQGVPAGFSSHGPTYDGRIKPNVAAQGVGTVIAHPGGTFTTGGGTSFSSPIIAGMMACLLQANPDMNNMELINAVQASGTLATNPDNKIGYGIPDFMEAHNILTIIDGENDDQISDISAYPNPFSSSIELMIEANANFESHFSIVDMIGKVVFEREYLMQHGSNKIQLQGLEYLPSGLYFIRIESQEISYTTKIVKE